MDQFFHVQEGHATEKLFWSQFDTPKRPLLNEQMAQWAELHKMSSTAMRDVIARLWPTKPIPDSYFSLVRRLVNAVPRIDAVKRLTCIEGAWMALACVKIYWAKMTATDIAARSPPEGKDLNMPEHYFEDVLEGQCSKNVMFE